MDVPEGAQGLEHHVETSPNGRYIRYSSVLGKGAYKTVYKAFDTEEALEVAWNKLHVDRLNEHDLDKVSNEVSLLRQVEHNNIIHFYDTWRGVDSNGTQSVNFITEQMMSGTLKEYLKKAKAIKLKVIRRWCHNILEAIAYLHNRDPPIMHRDLKCDNIFINGHVGEVKIGDLGLSGVKEREKADSVIGTPEFMAPELYEESYTEKVDIYAFGMCLLEMVTMEYPYAECNNMAQIFKKVFNGERPKAFDMLVEGDVKEVISACLQREARRPSAVDLLRHPLFSEWDKDDGRNSNLSLVKGTKENLERSNTTTQSSSTMPIGTELIEWSDPLNRNVLVSMLEGEAGAEQDQQVSVVAGRDDDGGGGFYIGLEIPIRDAIKRVEFTFDPFEDNSSHIAQEMVSEFGLSEEQLTVIRAEIDHQVDTAKELREAASRNATPQPPSRQMNPEGGSVIDGGQSVVSSAPNDSPPAPSVAPPLAESAPPHQPDMVVAPLDPQHRSSIDLNATLPPPAAPSSEHASNEIVPTQEHPLSVSMTSHASDTNGVAPNAPSEAGVNAHVVLQPQSAENVTVEHAPERMVHGVSTEMVRNVNSDQYSVASVEKPPVPAPESNPQHTIISDTPRSYQEVPHKQALADNVGSDVSLATTAPASAEIPPVDHQVQADHHQAQSDHHQVQPDHHQVQSDHHQVQSDHHPVHSDHHQVQSDHHQVQSDHHQVQSDLHQVQSDHHQVQSEQHQVHSEHHQATYVTAGHTSGTSVELPPSVASSVVTDGQISHSMNGNGSLQQVTQESQVSVAPSDPNYIANGTENGVQPNDAVHSNDNQYAGAQDSHNAHQHSSEHVMPNQSTPRGEHDVVHSVEFQHQSAVPTSRIESSERSVSGHHERPPHHPQTYASQNAGEPMAVHQPHIHHPRSGEPQIRAPSTPITPEPSVGLQHEEHHHVTLPAANHSGTTFAEPEIMNMTPSMAGGSSHGFVSSESVGEDLRSRRTSAATPKQRPNSTIPVIVVVPNEPAQTSNSQGSHPSGELPRSTTDVDTASVQSILKTSDSMSDTASIRKSISPDPSKKRGSREHHPRGSRGSREHISPLAARTSSGLSTRSTDSAGNMKEKASMSDEELYSHCLQLMEFCALGKFGDVRKALESGLPATFSDFDKRTPLHVAACEGHAEVCRILLDNGAVVDAKDKWGNTPLSEAQEGKLEEVEALLRNYGAVDGPPASDMIDMDLMQFSRKGNAQMVRNLLCAGAQATYADYSKRTVLHVACASGNEEVADILLMNGADVEARDKRGRNAVDHAIENGHRKMLRILRQYGASLPPDVSMSDPELLRIRGLELIDHSAAGNLDGVRFALDYGADVNFRDYDQRTALHLACAEGCLDVVEVLLLNGAETLARDRWDSTPYDEAVKGRFNDIVAELQNVELQRSQKKMAGRASGTSLGINGASGGTTQRGGDNVHFEQLSMRIAQSASLGAMPNMMSADDFAAKLPSSEEGARATIGSISSVSLPVTPFDRSGDASNDGETMEDKLPSHAVKEAVSPSSDGSVGQGAGMKKDEADCGTVSRSLAGSEVSRAEGAENVDCNGVHIVAVQDGGGEMDRMHGTVKADMQRLVNGLVDAAVSDG